MGAPVQAAAAAALVVNPAAGDVAKTHLDDIRWIQDLHTQHEELGWLADEAVVITQEGQSSSEASPSTRLFGTKYPEFDRTALTIRCLHLIIKGDEEAYQAFTEVQKDGTLTKKSFDALNAQYRDLFRKAELTPEKMQKLMEVALILGDMGKTKKAREMFDSVKAPDHDDFEREVMLLLKDDPNLCKSFAVLEEKERKILVDSTGLAHFGHIHHQEGGPEMFSGLKTLQKMDRAYAELVLDFALFIQRCDVAGALGHVNPNASITFTQNTFDGYEAVAKGCRVLLDPTKNEQDGYTLCLSERANLLGLDVTLPGDRILTRVGAMVRYFSEKEGQALKEAFGKIQDSSLVTEMLTCDQVSGNPTPTYVPAVLVNLIGKVGLEKAITLGLPVIASAVKQHGNSPVRLCFNPLAGQAKGDNAERLFAHGSIQIDAEGNVTLT